MVDVRSVVVRLTAENSQYIAKMQQTGAVTEASMGRVEKSTARASVGLTDVEKAGGLAAIALAGKAVLASADFEQAMSNVESATHGTAAEMASLEQAALDAGKATSFSATEAAAGIENLAKAGVSTSDILGGALTGSLDLAAAGTISVGDAAEYTATALTQFQLPGEQAAHVADLLAAGAGKAQGEVSDMALALSYAGVPAANLSVSIEETAGAIALLSKNGIIGEKAGTALRGMLGSLGSPSKIAAKEMETLGINVFDAQGKFIGFEGVAGQLQDKLSTLTQQEREQALGRIFGNEQAAAAGVFFREGAAGVAEMTAAVDDSGYAAETAAIKMDNLKGDVEVLMGSIETALIGSGEGSQDSLRSTTQLLTELVDVMSEAQNGSSTFSEGFRGATDQLSVLNSDAVKIGLGNLQKTTDFLFGAEDASKAAADASEEKAAADTQAANAAAAMSAKVQQSAEELKAQADAYDKARKAAADTAGEFFNLTDALNDSAVSLDDWIRQMAQQADALTNFTSNAEKAANKGLRDGLIAALKEAGPEGALRMKQLANATEGEINRANAAWAKGQKAINRYVDATAGVPGSVSSTLYLDSKGAMADLARARRELAQLDGTVVDTIIQMRTVRTGPGGQGTGYANATGGMYAQGVRYFAGGDVRNGHQAQMAPGGAWRVWAEDETGGESYIPHANDHRRPRARQILEDTASILGARSVEWYAKGGKKKKGNVGEYDDPDLSAAQDARDAERAIKQQIADDLAAKRADAAEQDRQRLVSMEEARIKAAEEAAAEAAKRQQEIAEAVLSGQERAWDMATDAAKAQVDAAQSLVDTVASSMNRIGTAATAMFRGNLFEQNTQKATQQRGLWVGDNAAASSSDWRARAVEDIQGLTERSGLIAHLSAQGLTGGALEALLGQSDNKGIADLIAKGEVGDYAALFKQREDLLGSVSAQSGLAGYGQEYAAASAQLVEMNTKFDRLNALITASRPVTVLEAVSAQATAAELIRLFNMGY